MSNLKVKTITHTAESTPYVVTVVEKTTGNYLDIGPGTLEDHESSVTIDNNGTVTFESEIKCPGITGYAASATADKFGREITTYYMNYDDTWNGLNELLSILKEEEDPDPPTS